MARKVVDAQVLHDEDLMRELRAMRRRARNLAPAFRRFAESFRRYNESHFATEGVTGLRRRWAPLSPDYAAWKFSVVGDRPILQLTGSLHDSLTGTEMDIEEIGPREATFGTANDVAIFHQRGTRFMPARPPLVVNQFLIAELERLAAEHVTEGFGDA